MKRDFLLVVTLVLATFPGCAKTPASLPSTPETAKPTESAAPSPAPAESATPSPFPRATSTVSKPTGTKPTGTKPTSKPSLTPTSTPALTPIPTPADIVRGTPDPDLTVDIYLPDRVWPGTTLVPLNYDSRRHRIVEVNMLGEIVWEYVVPGVFQERLVEAELLADNNVLYTVQQEGVYEINRSGKCVWQYLTKKIDHDADRLPNGNTIFVFGMVDQKSDAQAIEVNAKGEIVWQWYAKDHFDSPPYNAIFNQGWIHTNAVQRLSSGNTLISLRNFNLVAEVDPKGEVVRKIGEGVFSWQHDPEMLPNGNIIAANPTDKPWRAIELDPKTGKIVWQYIWRDAEIRGLRDANRLPNGNTLITGATEIREVTPEGEIAWRLRLQGNAKEMIIGPDREEWGFYKADRISARK